MQKRAVNLDDGPPLARVLPLFKDRSETLLTLVDEAMLFYEKLEAFARVAGNAPE